MNKVKVAKWDALEAEQPTYALVSNVDLVVIRWKHGEQASVLYGRCLHRGALLSDGHVDGEYLICGVHNWDYRDKTGVSEYSNDERLHKFSSWVESGGVWVDSDEIAEWERKNPQPYDREAYQGLYADLHGTPAEPHVKLIQELAAHGLERSGAHGPVSAMGVPGPELPRWADLQFLTAQLARLPRLDEEKVGTELIIGPNAARPLRLEIPLFVSDMSFGALSEEAKVSLARGAELSGTGIFSG